MKRIILLFLLCHNFVFAQNFFLNEKKFPEVYFLLKKSQQFSNYDKDSLLQNIDSGIIYSKKYNFNILLAKFYHTKAKLFDFYYEYDSSYTNYKIASTFFEKNGDSVNAAKCYINLGVTEYYYGNYDNAFMNYNKAENLLKNSNDTILKTKIFNNLGLVYKSLGNYKFAIQYFEEVLNLLEATDNENGIANTLLNIGVVYWEQKNYKEALKKFDNALKIYNKLKKDDDVASIYNNIGLIYSEKNDTSSAYKYFNLAIDIYGKLNNKTGIATTLLNKGLLLQANQKIDSAEICLKIALNYFEESNYKLGIYSVVTNLAWLYSLKKDKTKALKYALESLNFYDIDRPLDNLAKSYYVIGNTFFDFKNFEKSAEFYKKYIEIKDSVFSLQVNKQIVEIETKYETERKEAELKIYKQKVLIQNLEIDKKQKNLQSLFIILFLVIVFSIILIILFIQKQQSYIALVEQNIKLAKSDIEKENLLKNDKKTSLIINDLDLNTEDEKNEQKYPETNISEEQRKVIIDNLIILMEEEKVFLNQQITINDIAKQINTNRYYLSQVINDNFKTNFNNFINEFRVKEARKMLINPEFQNYSIEGIANLVGFHSKATFNSAFKKFTGVTPSFFKNNTKIV